MARFATMRQRFAGSHAPGGTAGWRRPLPRALRRPVGGRSKRLPRGGRWADRRAERRTRPGPERRRRPLTGIARGALMLVAFVCMVGFAVVLAKLTLVPSPTSVSLVHANFHPGASIRTYVDQPAFRDTVKQIGGNVLLGVPFGLLLPVLFPRARGLVRVVVLTALVMLCVEAVQGTVVEGRAFDIDDVLLNTFGALLGYLFAGRWLGRTVHPRRHHWWQRRAADPAE